MKFDLFSLLQKRDDSWGDRRVYDCLLEQIRLAEEIGLETAWFAEHHFNNYSLCPSPLVVIGYCAAFTQRIRLGTAVVVLPLYEPARLVQELALVDILTNGRLVIGVGAGYQELEFDRFRVDLKDNIAQSMEMLDIIELGLTQDQFSYDGKFYKLGPTQIAVKPMQKPMPEIWVAGLMGSPEFRERVATSGYVPFVTPSWNPTSSLAGGREAYDELYRSIGRDPATAPMSLMRFTHVTNDRREAIEAAERARYSSRLSLSLRLNYWNINGIYADEIAAKTEPPIEEMVDNFIIGDEEHCIQKIVEDYEIMRNSHIAFSVQMGGVPHERTMRTLEKLGTDVIPGVKKELARRGIKDVPPIVQQPRMAARQKAAE